MKPGESLVFVIQDGVVTCEASGFHGSACETAMKPFEQALGGEVSNKKRKPEFYQQASDGVRQSVGGKS